MLREEKGITLVALVLVIVVLLILAGVSIAVVVQNNNSITPNPNMAIDSLNPNSVKTKQDDAQTKVKLIFELLEANYQTELAKGTVIDRTVVFTSDKILESLTKYDIQGNTQSSLGQINLTTGVTVNYNDEYTFLVKVSDYGIVTVTEK